MANHDAESADDLRPSRWAARRFLPYGVSLLLAAGLLWLVLSRVAWSEAVQSIASPAWGWIVAAFALRAGESLLRGAYVRVIVGRGGLLPVAGAATLSQTLAWMLPGPAADAALAESLRRALRLEVAHAVKAAVATRVVEVTLRSALAAAVALTLPKVDWVRYTLAPTAAAIFVIGLWVIAWPQQLSAALKWIVAKSIRAMGRRPWVGKVEQASHRLLTLKDPTFLRREMPILASLSLVRWAVRCTATYAVFRSVGYPIPWLHAAYLLIMAGYVTAMPLRPPGDIGTEDAARVGLLISLGWDATTASTAVVACRVVIVAIILALGLASLGIVVAAASASGRGKSPQP